MVDHGGGANNPGIALASIGVLSLLGAEYGSLFLGFADEHYAFGLIEVSELFGLLPCAAPSRR
jgi:hypothetical protein